MLGNDSVNGISALTALDVNKDGVIDSRDSSFSSLMVWEAADSDGKATPDELISLGQAGITSINLTSQSAGEAINGSIVESTLTYSRGDNSTGLIGDVDLATEPVSSRPDTVVEIPSDVASLPQISGSGTLYDLHSAMVLDPALRTAVTGFLSLPSNSPTATVQQAIVSIIYLWGGVSNVDPGSRGSFVDARQLEFLESYFGAKFTQPSHNDNNPSPFGGAEMNYSWDAVFNGLATRLILQSPMASLYPEFRYDPVGNMVVAANGLGTAVQSLLSSLGPIDANSYESWRIPLQLLADAGNELGLTGTGLFNFLKAEVTQPGSETVAALAAALDAGQAISVAADGSFEVSGTTLNDTLYSAPGVETLIGHGGVAPGNNGSIVIGPNTDTTSGDVFVYSRGDGKVEIAESPSGGYDSYPSYATLMFGPGISSSDVLVSQNTTGDVILTIGSDGDQVTIKDQRSSGTPNYDGVASITFYDGTMWTTADLASALDTGNAQNTNLIGTTAGDYFKLAGFAHSVMGYGGGDTIAYEASDGDVEINEANNSGAYNNELLLGTGIDASDVTISAGANGSVILTLASTGSQIVIDNMLNGPQYGLQTVVFADGKIWSAQDIVAGLPLQSGVSADQYFSVAQIGFDQNGGSQLPGEIYLGNIDPGDVTFRTNEAGDLTVSTDAYAADDITIKGDLYGASQSRIPTANFAGGGTLSLNNLAFTYRADVGHETLTGTNWGPNTFVITAGGDTIFGARSDLYKFGAGAGDDTISTTAGENADTIAFDASVSAADVTLQAYGNDLVVTDVKAGIAITVKNDFWEDYGRHSHLSAITFGDGTSLSLANSDPITMTFDGTAGGQTVTGSGHTGVSNVILGGAGDTLNGANSDVYKLTASAGVQTINPTSWENGDTIAFDASVSAADVTLQAYGNDLVVTDVKAGISITVKNDLWQDYGRHSHLSAITFGDGTSLSLANSDPITMTFDGTAGGQTVTGSGHTGVSNVILGGAGDTLNGANSDVYKLTASAGVQTINPTSWENGDTIAFDASVSAADVTLQAYGNDLVVTDVKAGIAITVKNDFWEDYGRHSHLSAITFGDGTSLSLANSDPITMTFDGTAGGQTVTGSGHTGVSNVILGGAGDTLNGANNDTYKLTASAGTETINPSGWDNADTIAFDASVSAADVTLQAYGNDLVVTDVKASISITVKNDFSEDYGRHSHLSAITFGDGTSLSLANSDPITMTFDGTAGGQTVTGSGHTGVSNVILGGAGDTLNGANSDVYKLTASAGVQTINPTSWENGDTIAFDASVSAADVTLQAYGNDLVVTDVKAGISITVKNDLWQDYGRHSHLSAITFGDGTSLSLANSDPITMTFDGTAGGQTVTGSGHTGVSNVILGGAGDTLNGANSDVYKLTASAGVQTINPTSWENGDTIAFDASVSAADVTLQAYGNDLVVTDVKASISITVKNDFSEDYGRHSHLSAITFGDGTSLSLANSDPITMTFDGTAGGQTVTGSGHTGVSNVILGGAGDTLNGANSDVYKLTASAGVQTINPTSWENGDTIAFDASVSAADVTLQAYGNDLVVTDVKAGISITVKNDLWQDYGRHSHLNAITFADGTTLSLANNDAETLTFDGTAGGVTVTGSGHTNFSNVILGGAGDTLNGANNDTYKFTSTAGAETINPAGNENADTIVFDSSVNASDVTLQADNNGNLVVADQKAGIALTVAGNFWNDDGRHSHVGKISFADGSSISLTNGANITMTFDATAGNQTVSGSQFGNTNVFLGGAGDIFNGRNNDTYKFTSTAGTETINPSGGENADTIVFDGSVDAADVTLQSVGSDLIISDQKAGIALTVASDFWNDDGRHSHVGSISFADGSSISLTNGANITMTFDATAGNQTVSGSQFGNSNVFLGGAGDTFNGRNNDTYKFTSTAGTETINPAGGENADTIVFDASVNAADVTLQGDNNGNLVITDQKAGIALTVAGDFWNDDGRHSHVGSISFAGSSSSISLSNGANITMTFDATAGNQTVSGSQFGNTNVFLGGAGDTFNGRNNDTYKFTSTAGAETINPAGGENADTIVFDSSVNASDVTLQADNNGNLVVTDQKAGIALTVAGDFWNDYGRHSHVGKISFADGSSISLTNGANITMTFDATAGNQTVSGSQFGNTNVFLGGAGDTFNGRNNDTYKFTSTAGTETINPAGNENADTIVFDSSVNASDVTLQADNNGNLVVTDQKAGIALTVAGDFWNDYGRHSHVGSISFADGSSISLANGANITMTFDAMAGNQTVSGSQFGNTNVFLGGAGDTFNGRNNDTYKFTSIAGAETINPAGNENADTIVFDSSVNASDVTLQADNNGNLVITDQQAGIALTVAGDFWNDYGRHSHVGSISFADGSSISLTNGANITMTFDATAGNQTVSGSQFGNTNVFLGGAGDTFNGRNNDTYKFTSTAGTETINPAGNENADTIVFDSSVNASDVTLQADNNGNLVVTDQKAGIALTVAGDFWNDYGRHSHVGSISFADGSSISLANGANITMTFDAMAGNQTVSGSQFGNTNVFLGGAGDTFNGRNNDTYKFTSIAGAETINPAGNENADTIVFDSSVNASDVTLQADNNGNLVITDQQAGIALTVAGDFWNDYGRHSHVGSISFADGSSISLTNGANITMTFDATAGNQTVSGSQFGNTNVFLGGAGDTFNGRNNDTYKFTSTAGTETINPAGNENADTIVFDSSVNASDVTLQADNNGNLVVTDQKAGIALTVAGDFWNDYGRHSHVGSISFADGSSISLANGANITMTFDAMAGNQTVSGSQFGNTNVFLGGAGDTFNGRNNDTYKFTSIAGAETINPAGNENADTIVFDSSVNASDVTLQADNNGNLVITDQQAGIALTVAGDFWNDYGRHSHVGSISFADGSSISLANGANITMTFDATAGNQTVSGSQFGNTNVFLGGAGDIFNGRNNDTYKFTSTAGTETINPAGNENADTIVFDASVDAADVTLQGDNNGNLVITDQKAGIALTVAGDFWNDYGRHSHVGSIGFADGSSISLANGANITMTFDATAGNQTVSGSQFGNTNVFLGGAGDIFNGRNNDTYKFTSTAGTETINPAGGENADSIVFDGSVNPADVTLQAVGSDLIITDQTAALSLTVTGEFWNDYGRHAHVGSIGFADGSSYSISDFISGTALSADDSGTTLVGSSGADTFTFTQPFASTEIENFTASGINHDIIEVKSTVFSDWAHLLGATQQIGADLQINIDDNQSILLKDVSLTAFNRADVRLV